jgi:aldehyde dehydrogenase (NAD+)
MPPLPTLTDEFYIGGKWIPASDPRNRYQVISPVNEDVVAEVADPTLIEADAAVAAARHAFDYGPWPSMSVAERADYLRRFCDQFERRLDDFNAAWTAESGPPTSHATRLGGNVIMLWRDLLGRADDLQVAERRSYPGGDVDVVREPVGVALIPPGTRQRCTWRSSSRRRCSPGARSSGRWRKNRSSPREFSPRSRTQSAFPKAC